MLDFEIIGLIIGNLKWFVCVFNKYILNYKLVYVVSIY